MRSGQLERFLKLLEISTRDTRSGKPCFWWASERIYGVPDLVVHTSWLADKFHN